MQAGHQYNVLRCCDGAQCVVARWMERGGCIDGVQCGSGGTGGAQVAGMQGGCRFCFSTLGSFTDAQGAVNVECGWHGKSRFPAQGGCTDVVGAARVSSIACGCGDDARCRNAHQSGVQHPWQSVPQENCHGNEPQGKISQHKSWNQGQEGTVKCQFEDLEYQKGKGSGGCGKVATLQRCVGWFWMVHVLCC